MVQEWRDAPTDKILPPAPAENIDATKPVFTRTKIVFNLPNKTFGAFHFTEVDKQTQVFRLIVKIPPVWVSLRMYHESPAQAGAAVMEIFLNELPAIVHGGIDGPGEFRNKAANLDQVLDDKTGMEAVDKITGFFIGVIEPGTVFLLLSNHPVDELFRLFPCFVLHFRPAMHGMECIGKSGIAVGIDNASGFFNRRIGKRQQGLILIHHQQRLQKPPGSMEHLVSLIECG